MHRWYRIWRGFEVEESEVGEIIGRDDSQRLYQVHWPAHGETVWVPMACVDWA